VFENSVLRIIFGSEKEAVRRIYTGRNCVMRSFVIYISYSKF
jgi:hypothetical protein